MCFPPPQIIVFPHPPHSASDYLSPLSSSIVHNQWTHRAHTDQQLPSFWFVLKGAEGGEGWGGRLAGYTRSSDGLSAPSSSRNSDLSPHGPSSPFSWVEPWRTESGGGVVFQQRRCCTGQPAFIRMNQWGDKIGSVTKLGYEIRVLIEFSRPGQGYGALNIIEFDRLMKRAPMLVVLHSTGPRERCPHPPYADVQLPAQWKSKCFIAPSKCALWLHMMGCAILCISTSDNVLMHVCAAVHNMRRTLPQEG